MLDVLVPLNTPRAERALDEFRERGGELDDKHTRALLGHLAEHAPALLPLALSDLELPRDVLSLGLTHSLSAQTLGEDLADHLARYPHDPRIGLRRWRHRHVVRIALQEVLRVADVDETSAAMSALASAATDAALSIAQTGEEERSGVAVSSLGEKVTLVAIGMGKLGGWELNLGSDIDLCFFYGTDDATVGDGATSAHEHFARIVSRAVAFLSDVTADGFCFRVDLRLRPEGTRGPLVNSIASAERYYEAWGRTWERAALLRSRPIAGDLGLGIALAELLRPFVWRRRVDPKIAEEMRGMVERARRELKVDEARDVKLGRGGIREAEFFVQSLQLVWGGQHPELMVPGTMQALTRLEAAGLVREREARSLSAAWARLRRIEHRIHVWTGYQTHRLPPEGQEREAFARSLGFVSAERFDRALAADRATVAKLFDSLVPAQSTRTAPDRTDELCDRIAEGESSPDLVRALGSRVPFRDPEQALAQLHRLARRADAPFGPVLREEARELAPRILDELASVADPDGSLRNFVRFSSRLYGWSWERVFRERPLLLRRLIGLFGTSSTLTNALIGHPGELDQLLAPGVPDDREVELVHSSIEGNDPESVVHGLRRAARALTLRAGLSLAADEIDLDQATRVLSATAEAQIRVALAFASREAIARYGAPDDAALAVVALGKLGGQELGFGGDLDLMFVYDREGETRGATPISHAELFARIAQRIMRLLSQPDAEGRGYSTDVRLRPSGSQGTLVVSLHALEHYHSGRASVWERQALIKARCVAGPLSLVDQVSAALVRHAYEGEPVDLRAISEMRARIQREIAREHENRYDPKLGFGGLLDVEFLAQGLQLVHGRTSPSVRTPRTLEALDALMRIGALAPEDERALREGFMFMRSIEQTIRRLDESREPVLRLDSPVLDTVARTMRIRDRDGQEPREGLLLAYRRIAGEVRSIVEARIGPVDAPAPFGGSS